MRESLGDTYHWQEHGGARAGTGGTLYVRIVSRAYNRLSETLTWGPHMYVIARSTARHTSGRTARRSIPMASSRFALKRTRFGHVVQVQRL